MSEASSRSVSRTRSIASGKRLASEIPTIPQPAPNSRILFPFLDSVLCSRGVGRGAASG
jgi:hypothetical protein